MSSRTKFDKNLTLSGICDTVTQETVRATRSRVKEKNKVFIQVSDNGLGIPEEKLEELFSKDYREKGSAFGLFNIQQRLQIYFGKEYGLTVESKLSQGTKATVCIPVDFKREEDRK